MSDSTMPPPDHDELAAREQIRELVAAYTHLGDGGRLDEMTTLFEPAATLDAFGTTYRGHDEVKSFFSGIGFSRCQIRRNRPFRSNPVVQSRQRIMRGSKAQQRPVAIRSIFNIP